MTLVNGVQYADPRADALGFLQNKQKIFRGVSRVWKRHSLIVRTHAERS